MNEVSFDYRNVSLKDIVVRAEQKKTGKHVVRAISLDGDDTQPSSRFWTSIFAKYGFNSQFFKYFDYSEVFDRIADRNGSDKVRVCVETKKIPTQAGGVTERKTVLAATGVDRPLLKYDELSGLVKDFGGDQLQYSGGILSSTHSPRIDGGEFTINGDSFCNKFSLHSPIDGFGNPNLYLMLLRQICGNGAIGFTKAFRSQVAVGKGESGVFALTKALDGFNNEEGFAAIRQRFESAQSSWASVYETAQLYRTIAKAANTGGITGGKSILTDRFNSNVEGSVTEELPILSAFHKLTGDTALTYGISNLDSLTVKRQRTLPVKCTVYDALNFATEVATHHANPEAARSLQAWVGQLISGEYDMEGTKEKFGDFADFHVDKAKLAIAAS
jgi:hypothetical protein